MTYKENELLNILERLLSAVERPTTPDNLYLAKAFARGAIVKARGSLNYDQ